MRVLVVARTRMGGGHVCVGALELDSGAGVRLLGHDEENLDASHPIRPGEVWDVRCSPRPVTRPPHTEDVVVTKGHRVEVVDDLRSAILALTEPETCPLDGIFDGRLAVTDGGSAFLRDEPPIPTYSTCF